LAAVPSIGRASAVEPRSTAPEAQATSLLYERHARQIFNFCLHRLGNREEAEDAAQTTFLNAFRGIQRGVTPEIEQAWLFKIAENVCLTRHRSSFRRRRVESPSDLGVLQEVVPSPPRDAETLIRLSDALAEMPDQQRRALLLREWQGLSYREIADELDLSQPAVETLLFRARRSLASFLTEAPNRKRRARLRAGFDVFSIALAFKAAFGGGGAVTVAALAAVASTTAIAGAKVESQEHARTPVASHKSVPAIVSPGNAASVRLRRLGQLPQGAHAPRASRAPVRARAD
jgi:RNA polymerase sigma-70 factor (ECF subfamily)